MQYLILLGIIAAILYFIVVYVLPLLFNLLVIAAVIGVLFGGSLAFRNYLSSFYRVMFESKNGG